ncbi:hypothetical protein JK386_14535 [Nocardioides sp. zg-536]|uniref:Uncharacterized protein n=1 Tax=Nocardioides faecalis TaxID=2803858 RepID=A0A938Y3C8_9ACTN|nr:hypothetical protein [Nocardioides faecalis]MBM9461116.1 hypothetical protein [Nocardioides faecalis]QVI58972.1 hypothetical protein KG111_00790 [Nocardioides faecalis]
MRAHRSARGVVRTTPVRAVLLALAAVLLTVPVLTAPALTTPAGADSYVKIFPSRAVVKSALGGTGRWVPYRAGDVRALGATPAACRSDLQLLDFRFAKVRNYYGHEKGMPHSVSTRAEIAVVGYASRAKARAAVARLRTYAERCPRVREWTCEDCDGVATTVRTSVRTRRVGTESTAWRFREVGNFKSKGYAVVARRGTTLVRVTVSRIRDPFAAKTGWTYPKLIDEREVVRLARKALAQAAPLR